MSIPFPCEGVDLVGLLAASVGHRFLVDVQKCLRGRFHTTIEILGLFPKNELQQSYWDNSATTKHLPPEKITETQTFAQFLHSKVRYNYV